MKKIERFQPSIHEGLNSSQIEKRYIENFVNYEVDSSTKSIKEIIKNNTFTLFNIINLVLAVAIVFVGSFKNLTFISVVIINTLISIIQEIRSKKMLDKLKVVASSKVNAIRNGKSQLIEIEQLVLDDVITFEIGNQVVVDSIIKDGEVEVNESFITGESNTVIKKRGDLLLSGSFIVSGKAICQVEHIGLDNYIAKISSNTKYIKPNSSEIMKSLNKIVSTISFVIVPIGILLFSRQLYIEGNSVSQAVVSTVAGLIGMIPEGLVLLTSTVLAVSVIRLSHRKVLVQDLYCIETLARVDTICLDKTGTITEGKMEVVGEIKFGDYNLEEILMNISYHLDEINPTAVAIKDKYGQNGTFNCVEKIPFSSSRKYSGIVCEDKTYVIGAHNFIIKDSSLDEEVKKYSKDYRVIVVAESSDKNLKDVKALGLVLLQDKIRDDAKETLQYFKDQGVSLKIISGDHPDTVLGIAKRAGFEDNILGIDATHLKSDLDIFNAAEKYDVFGRVTPEQKRKLILALQKLGHTVAMTGDGVNDVLALKESDCSVAMASGSDASKNVSQLVLLDSNFSSMPYVVAEGRRTINNIERSASLFLVKTIYASLLAVLFIFLNSSYPFIPIQLTLISTLTIGIPSFILALEPNYEIVKGHFLKRVLKRSFPPAITIFINIIFISIVSNWIRLNQNQISTLATMTTAFTSFVLLYKTCLPFNGLRLSLFISMILLFLSGFFGFGYVFNFTNISLSMCIIFAVCIGITYICYFGIEKYMEEGIDYFKNKVRKR